MKQLIIISVILLLSNISYGQEGKLSIGLQSSLDKFNFDFLPYAGFNHKYDINSAYSFGLNVKYSFSERFFSKGAIQYSKKGYNLDYEFNFMNPGDPLIPRKTTINLYYIGVPLFVGYNLYNGNTFKISTSFGLVNELLIDDDETSTFEDNSERESKYLDQNLKKYLISSQLNLGFDYHLSDKIFLSLEPYLRIGFTAIDNEIMKSNSMSYGGILSVNYILK